MIGGAVAGEQGRRERTEAFYKRLCGTEPPEMSALREQLEADAAAAIEREDKKFKEWAEERERQSAELKERRKKEAEEAYANNKN